MKKRLFRWEIVLVMLFSICAVVNIIGGKTIVGILYFISAMCFLFSYIMALKNNKSEVNLTEEEIEKIDNELKQMILDGEEVKAVKRYRELTNSQLLEAKNYIDKLK
ncbi:hypothetical protein [Clostridium sp. CCUG 7971]|uniref:hypothetical protein n=1 Tax=Clostridium sp. CCUG 7971 TaxID=2811414 RepID=UPI001ABB4722|nr:hypothetical protein [Clostridium sp. CCUG 7971]MBO3443918.1 hypothetical protein [Clostridium sp. CCUG 7971]